VAKDIKNNPNKFYVYLWSKIKVKDTIGPLKDNDGKLVIYRCRLDE